MTIEPNTGGASASAGPALAPAETPIEDRQKGFKVSDIKAAAVATGG